MQIFRPSADTIARVLLTSILGVPFLAIAIAHWIMRSPYMTNQDLPLSQPVPFSHEHHVELQHLPWAGSIGPARHQAVLGADNANAIRC